MTAAFICLILLVVFSAIAFKIFLCLFIYNDAKERSDNPALWVVVVFFVPNFIGLLLYFLIGRKRMVSCPTCTARMPQGSLFCPSCGCETVGTAVTGFSQSAKRSLIAFIASLALLIVAVAALVIISVCRSMYI